MPSKFHIPPTKERNSMIRGAVKSVGGARAAAEILGLSFQRVRQFWSPGMPVPAEMCRRFVKMCKGQVTLRALRPDLYDGLTASELGYEVRAKSRKG